MSGTCGSQSPGQLGASNWVLGIKLGSSRSVISAPPLQPPGKCFINFNSVH